MPSRTLAAVALLASAATTHAALLSFASDTSDHSWTYTGLGPTINGATGPSNTLTLQIDDNNGPLPVISVTVRFSAEYSLFYIGSVPLGGGTFSHNYLSTGNFAFADAASGAILLNGHFDDALLTARGDQTSWFTTASIQGDNNGSSRVNYGWQGQALPGYGLMPGVALLGNLAFDLSSLNSSGAIPYSGQAPGRTLDSAHRPSSNWWAESSFSALTEVPAPSTAALFGLAGAVCARRRR